MSDLVDNTTRLPRSNTAKRNKQYGFRAEAELLEFLRANDDFLDGTERLHLTGQEDEGDLVISRMAHPIIVQLKTFSVRTQSGQERPLSPATIKRWLEALDAQKAAYEAHRGLEAGTVGGILVVKFKGRAWEDALVINSLGRWLG